MMIKFFSRFIILVSFFYYTSLKSQSLDPFYLSIVNNVSYDTLYNNLQVFESLGIKTPNSQALENTKNWLIAQYLNYGYSDIEIDSFNLNGSYNYNIIVTKTGVVSPDTFFIIDAHYDTYNGPGANDNGSGTCILLEVARLLKNVDTKYSIKYIHFSCEEAGGYGSYHYVSQIAVPQNLNIRLLLNIDEVGGIASNISDSLICESDQSPPLANNAMSFSFTDTLSTLTELYSSLNAKLDSAWGSDYVPFQQQGFIITGYFENGLSPYCHTLNDSISNLDFNYLFEVCKASTGSSLYFSGAYNSTGIDDNEVSKSEIIIYQNQFSENITIIAKKDYKLEFINLNGQVIKKLFLKSGVSFINPNELPYNIYILRALTNNDVLSRKIIQKSMRSEFH